jgi:chromosome segregation ATPase
MKEEIMSDDISYIQAAAGEVVRLNNVISEKNQRINELEAQLIDIAENAAGPLFEEIEKLKGDVDYWLDKFGLELHVTIAKEKEIQSLQLLVEQLKSQIQYWESEVKSLNEEIEDNWETIKSKDTQIEAWANKYNMERAKNLKLERRPPDDQSPRE